MTVIRKNRCGNNELEKRAHTSVQETKSRQTKNKNYKIKNQNKIDRRKNMKNSKITANKTYK